VCKHKNFGADISINKRHTRKTSVGDINAVPSINRRCTRKFSVGDITTLVKGKVTDGRNNISPVKGNTTHQHAIASSSDGRNSASSGHAGGSRRGTDTSDMRQGGTSNSWQTQINAHAVCGNCASGRRKYDTEVAILSRAYRINFVAHNVGKMHRRRRTTVRKRGLASRVTIVVRSRTNRRNRNPLLV
jgi:hypothetical protein